MRLLFVVPWGENAGGAERRLLTTLRHFDRRRVDAHVVFLADGPWVEELREHGITVSTVNAGRLRQLRRGVAALRALIRLLRSEQPDLVVGWSAKAHLYSGSAALLAGMRSRALWWQLNIPRPQWLDRIATLVPARAVACSSHAVARAQAEIRPRRTTFVVNPGIDAPAAPSAQEVAELRLRLNIPAERTILASVGRIEPYKRQHLLLDAAGLLARRGFDVHVLLVGGPSQLRPQYAHEIAERAAASPLGDRISVVGHVAEPSPYVALADVIVNTSMAEAFGIVLLEAMAASKPVVAFASGGPLEIVADGVTGMLVETDGAEALARALEPLLRDASLRERLGAAGRVRFEERFTAERMMSELMGELDRLA